MNFRAEKKTKKNNENHRFVYFMGIIKFSQAALSIFSLTGYVKNSIFGVYQSEFLQARINRNQHNSH